MPALAGGVALAPLELGPNPKNIAAATPAAAAMMVGIATRRRRLGILGLLRAHVAETTLTVDAKHRKGAHPLPAELRLVVRRVLNHHPTDPQQPLFSEYRYFPILTSRTDDLLLVEAEHREHAKIELVIRDRKDAGLAHLPSGKMYANMAWLVLATLAHNLQRWTAILGLQDPRIRHHRTIRNRYLAVPGRLVSHARRQHLRLPTNWPWRDRFLAAIERLRALPQTT